MEAADDHNRGPGLGDGFVANFQRKGSRQIQVRCKEGLEQKALGPMPL